MQQLSESQLMMLEKPSCDVGAVPFVLANLSRLGISDTLTPTYYCTEGRSSTCLPPPVISVLGFFPFSVFQNITQSQYSMTKRGIFILDKYQSHIQTLNYAHTSPPQCQHSVLPFLPPITCIPSEGRERSKEELEMKETSKFQKTGDKQWQCKKVKLE